MSDKTELEVKGQVLNLMLLEENKNSIKKYLAVPWRGMWVAEVGSGSQTLQEFQDIYSCREFWLGLLAGRVSHEFWI